MKRLLGMLLAVSMMLACLGGSALAESKEPVVLDMFVDEFWWPYQDWSGDLPRWFVEQTGVDFDVTIAADTTELSMIAVSGDLPDIVVTSQFNLMSNSDLCYTWEELIEKYDIDAAIHPAYKFVNTAVDGNMYTIQVGWSADYEYEQFPGVNPEGSSLVMRKDILDAVLAKTGLTEIKTVEDLEKCFDACLKLYPDVVPHTVCDTNQLYRWHEALYGAGRNGFVDKDGQAMLWIYDDNYRAAVLKMAEWMRKGYMVAENLSWNGITIGQEWELAGRVFTQAHLTSGSEGHTNAARNAGLDYTFVPLTTIYTDTSAEIIPDVGWRGLYITKNCKDPEAAIKAALALYSKDIGYTMLWGFEHEDWDWNDDKTVTYHYESSDTELAAKRQFKWGWLGHDGISNNMQWMKTDVTRDGLQWVGSIAKRNPVLGIVMNRMDVESDEYIIYQNILELERTYQSKILLAKTAEEAEAAFDEMIKTADDLGGQQVNAWANALYPEMSKAYEEVRSIGAEGWERK